MAPIDWIVISIVAVSAIAALISIIKGKGRCIGCNGDCSNCHIKH